MKVTEADVFSAMMEIAETETEYGTTPDKSDN